MCYIYEYVSSDSNKDFTFTLVKQQRKGEERDKCDSGSNGMDVNRFRDDFTLKECVLYIQVCVE